MAKLTHLPGPKGKDNQPGLKSIIYFAPEDWFEEIKKEKTTTGVGDSVTIDGAHTFKDDPDTPGKKLGFLKLYGTPDSAQLKLDPSGERDGRGKKASFEFFNPGNTPEAAEFDRQVKNVSGIALLQTPDGVVQQVGTEGLGVELLGSYDSGKLSGGRRGYTFKGEAYQNGNLFYPGEISLKEA